MLDRFADAALSVSVEGQYLQQPLLLQCACHLLALNEARIKEKGKPMSADHLKQEALKWARTKLKEHANA